MSHKSSSSPVKSTCQQLVSACVWLQRKSFYMCTFYFGMNQSIACMQRDTHTHTHMHAHLHTDPQVIFILARGRWQSRNNNQVWLHILFSQTSSKLSPSPSSCMLWASPNRQHQSHFIGPDRLSPSSFSWQVPHLPTRTSEQIEARLVHIRRSKLSVLFALLAKRWWETI